MILVDTSVWIDFFRDVESCETTWLINVITDNDNLCICGPILAEILQGIVSGRECKKVKRFFSPFIYLPTLRNTYYLAADIYRAARANGKTVRNTIDCIIAACAIENDVQLLQQDKDFLTIADVSKLKLVNAE